MPNQPYSARFGTGRAARCRSRLSVIQTTSAEAACQGTNDVEACVFIQMVQGRCSRHDEMRDLVDDWCAMMADRPGWLGGTYGFTDDDRFLGIVRFDSGSACKDAAGTSEAATMWAGAEELFDGRCEIHESEDVSMMLDGGSDSAGFVQVMRGRVADADRFRHFMTDTEVTSMLHDARPEIIGATLAIESDGTFLETVAFTDEASARKGEQLDMPAEMQADFEAAMADVEYLDLHKPWFASHR